MISLTVFIWSDVRMEKYHCQQVKKIAGGKRKASAIQAAGEILQDTGCSLGIWDFGKL